TGQTAFRIADAYRPDATEPTGVRFSANGRTVAIAAGHRSARSTNSHVRLFAVPAGAEIGCVRIADSCPFSSTLALSPDGRFAAVRCADDREIGIWETASGLFLHCFAGHRECVWSITFAPDGRTLASGGADGVVYVWDATFPLRAKRQAA